jgi:uncharacterized membrane protein YqhA
MAYLYAERSRDRVLAALYNVIVKLEYTTTSSTDDVIVMIRTVTNLVDRMVAAKPLFVRNFGLHKQFHSPINSGKSNVGLSPLN